MRYVEKEFILDPRKFAEYKGSRFYNGVCALVVDTVIVIVRARGRCNSNSNS